MKADCPDDIKPFYSAEEAAAILGVAPKTIRRWARLAYIKTVRAGERGHFRVPASSIFKSVSNAFRHEKNP